MADNKSIKKLEDIFVESKLAAKLFYALLFGNLFFHVVLFSPDSTILAADATLKIPIIGEPVSMRGFIVFGPLILIAGTLYSQTILLHMVTRNTDIDANDRGAQNVSTTIATVDHIVVLFLFYCFTPVSLIILWWTALPRPESLYLFVLFLAYLFVSRSLHILSPSNNKTIMSYSAYCSIILILFIFGYFALVLVFPGKTEWFRSFHLVKADLLNKDLRSVNLTHANMDEVDFSGSNLEGATLKHAMSRSATFTKSILTRTDFEDASLVKSDFREANLAKANFHIAKLADTKFTGAEISDAIFIDADLVGANFAKATLYDSNLIKAELYRANFTESDISGADFHGANLGHSILNKVDGYGSRYLLTQLLKAEMKDVKMQDTMFQFADMSKVKMHRGDFTGADFTCARLTDVQAVGTIFDKGKFVNANLEGVDLEGASLRDTDLMCANLSKATLSNSNFERAELSYVNFKETDLKEARNLTCRQLERVVNLSVNRLPRYLQKCRGSNYSDISREAIDKCKTSAQQKEKDVKERIADKGANELKDKIRRDVLHKIIEHLNNELVQNVEKGLCYIIKMPILFEMPRIKQ